MIFRADPQEPLVARIVYPRGNTRQHQNRTKKDRRYRSVAKAALFLRSPCTILPLPGGEVVGYHFQPMKRLSNSPLVLCWVAWSALNAQAGPLAERDREKSAPAPASAAAVSLVKSGEGVEVTAPSYRFDWTVARDEFRLADSQGRAIVSGRIGPVVTVQPLGKTGARKLVSATVQNWSLEGERLKIGYREASGSHEVEVVMQFSPGAIWLEPIRFQAGDEDVVAVHYFSRSHG
jgi:hypothetical protein